MCIHARKEYDGAQILVVECVSILLLSVPADVLLLFNPALFHEAGISYPDTNQHRIDAIMRDPNTIASLSALRVGGGAGIWQRVRP